MWFRYLISFVDFALSLIIVFSALKFDKEKDKNAFIGAFTIFVCLLISAILMWR